MLPTRSRLVAVLLLLPWAALVPRAVTASPSENPPEKPAASPSENLAAWIDEALAVSVPTRSAQEFATAAEAYRGLLDRLETLDTDGLSRDEQIDADLLERHLRTRVFEIEDARLHQLVPVRYFALHSVSALFLRPCSGGSGAIETAIEALTAQPAILDSARANLDRPARIWTENAIVQARYAEQMLADML
ncbi:MAG: DUF885 family protein, partial [Holophagales bacterium]|nr:DUF885 family protein [Holophagales bacterium]